MTDVFIKRGNLDMYTHGEIVMGRWRQRAG